MPTLTPLQNLRASVILRVPETLVFPDAFTVNPEGLTYRAEIAITTRSYRNGAQLGFQNDEDKAAFTEAALDIAEAVGLAPTKSGTYAVDQKGLEYIHFHPDGLKGTLTEDRILKLIEAVKASPVSDFECVDIFSPQEILSDGELMRRAAYHKDTLRQRLRDAVKTTRVTRYLTHCLESVASGLVGLEVPDGYPKHLPCYVRHNERLLQVVEEMRQEMVREGLLKTAEIDGHAYYRAANKTELREQRR